MLAFYRGREHSIVMKRFERLRFSTTDYSHKLGERTVLWTMRQPEYDQSNDISLVVPGIMAKRRLYNSYAEAMAERGQSIATMAHQGASPLCATEVSMVAESLANTYQRPVRLIGHSLGGMHATLSAHDKPDNISGVLLMQPAGYGGVYPAHAVASLLDRPDNHHIGDELRAVFDGLDYFRSSRLDHMARTIVMASRHHVIEKGTELADHIAREAVLFPDDKLIHTDKCKDGLARAGFAWLDLDLAQWHQDNSTVRRWYPAGHNAIMYHPQAVADATLEVLDASFGAAA
jgi:pimeloyl-ACP methyl ester carboxylesterase